MSAPATPTVDDAPDRAGELTSLVDAVCEQISTVAGDVRQLADDRVRAIAPLLDRNRQAHVVDDVVARLAGLGPLDRWFRDPAVDEILVNRGREVWVDRSGTLEPVGTLDDHRLEHLLERILAPIGRRLDRTSPVVDARLADGSRVCAVVEPLAVDGPVLAIRRFAARIRPLEEFTDDDGAGLCRELVDGRCNVVVSGPTSSGKTSLLAALVGLLPGDERVIVLEDTSELPVVHRHLVRLEARPPTADLPAPIGLDALVTTALRLRPDRLIVGEVRGPEVLALVQAINTGHDGSLTTCHANSAADTLLRLESLVLQAAPSWPMAAIREQLRRSLDVVIHVRRDANGARAIDTIAEVVEPDGPSAHTTPADGLRVLYRRRGREPSAGGGTRALVRRRRGPTGRRQA